MSLYYYYPGYLSLYGSKYVMEVQYQEHVLLLFHPMHLDRTATVNLLLEANAMFSSIY